MPQSPASPAGFLRSSGLPCLEAGSVDVGRLTLIAGALLAVGLVASLAAPRLRLPGLVLFLGIGMAVGSEGLGWISFDNYDVARTIGIIALGLILFEGGLAAGFDEIRPVLGSAISLALIGTLVTALIGGFVAAWLFDLSTLEGLLVGSIVASTDGAAIFAVLRGSSLRRKLARTLEGEAGLNDPVAVLLVLGFIDWIQKPGYGVLDMASLFVREIAIGTGVGLAVGWLASNLLQRMRLASAGLYPVASVATAALAYGVADVAHGSGFLAIYLTGLWLGSSPIPGKRTITTFHDGLAWLAQLAMFLTLGLLVFPSDLGDVAVEGTVLGLLTAAVARPVGTFIATAFGGYSIPERFILGWAGLRGAVPVVLATFPVLAHVPGSLKFFDIVFFAVLVSTVLQGSSFEPLARLLKVTAPVAALPRPLAETGTIRSLGAEVAEYPVGAGDAIAGLRVRELGLPRDALLNVIVRGEQAIPPRGSTRIEEGDRLHVLVRQEAAMDFSRLLQRWRSGPIGHRERKPRPITGKRPVHVTRPWSDPADEGEPGRPVSLAGVPVIEQLRTRRDGVAGALVLLEDGRYGASGPTVIVGGPRQLRDTARRKLRRAATDSERAWWREVIGALAAPED
jgi:cell volume regulation protein A